MRDEKETVRGGVRGRTRRCLFSLILHPSSFILCLCGCSLTAEQVARNIILPEQRTVAVRDPSQLPPAPIPPLPPPRTVTDPQPGTQEWHLSLDEAIRTALVNAKVIRVLAGATAVSSGRTIYDAAIVNTTIDQEQARFDP